MTYVWMRIERVGVVYNTSIVNGFKNFKRRSVHLLTNRWVINSAGNENQRQNFTMSFTRLSLGFVTPSLEVK